MCFFLFYVVRSLKKRGLPRRFACFVLFYPVKKRSFNLLCVLDLFSERWQSTLFQSFFLILIHQLTRRKGRECSARWSHRHHHYHHHHHHHHHHHQSLNREGRWGTTDDFATSFLHFSLFSTALCDLANLRPDVVFRTSSSVCLVFFPLSLCLARWFWTDLMNGWHDRIIEVCVSLW